MKSPIEKVKYIQDDKKQVTRYNLMAFESFMNCLPTILGALIWSVILLLGFNYLKIEFTGQSSYGLVMVVWMIVIGLPMMRIIPTPSLVYREVDYE